MTRSMMTALSAVVVATAIATGSTAAQDRPFRSMAVEDGSETACPMPEVPSDLTPTMGHEDAYKYWLQKLDLERRLETGECDCQVDNITWEEVGDRALPWLNDTSRLFIIMRNEIEQEIEDLQAAVRAECEN